MPDRPSDARFYKLIANLQVGVVVQGPRTEVLVCNAAALELLGLDEDQFLGKSSYDPDWNIIHEDGSPFPAEARPMATVLATGKGVRDVIMGVYRPRRKDRAWLLVNAEPEFDAEGRVVEVVATLIDLTTRKQLESSLLEARKLESIGRLAGGIAHDFNNLLTVITSATSLAMATLPEDAPILVDLQASLDAADRGAAFTRQLLTFARRRPGVVEIVRVPEVVGALAPLLTRLAGTHVALHFDVNPGTWPIAIDVAELEQVLMNLVVNARDAMASGGALHVRAGNVSLADGASGGRDFARIVVQDEGAGMSPATRERLFEPFFTTRPAGQGTGLGLATVHGIVQQHGGHIEVESELGRGSTFSIYFPRAKAAATSTRERLEATLGGSETILVVEDNAPVRRLTQRLLERLGYTVLVASNGAEALEVVAAHEKKIDLLLTDFTMPRMNGDELALALQKSHPSIRVIVTSGLVDRQRFSAQRWAFLDKPYMPEQLAAAVRASLDAA
jgi:PAS domain S-box-containing protein